MDPWGPPPSRGGYPPLEWLKRGLDGTPPVVEEPRFQGIGVQTPLNRGTPHCVGKVPF
jgi:hypothetical protein